MTGIESSSARKTGVRILLGLVMCVVVSFLVLAYPLYVIRPFRYQGPRELSLALAVLGVRPWVEISFVLAAAVLAFFSWKQAQNMWRKVVASVCAVLLIAFAGLSRVNVYELMFHPLDRTSFSSASKSKLGDGEEVIAVRLNRSARAYPIRIMSYHHIVNDVVGGIPLVATY